MALISLCRASACSGAMYDGEPQAIRERVSSPSASLSLAMPKSQMRGTHDSTLPPSQARLPGDVVCALESVQNDVGRFQVAVKDAALVGVLHGACQCRDNLGSPSR